MSNFSLKHNRLELQTAQRRGTFSVMYNVRATAQFSARSYKKAERPMLGISWIKKIRAASIFQHEIFSKHNSIQNIKQSELL